MQDRSQSVREAPSRSNDHCLEREQILHSASRIVQAQSALFLLVYSSRAPDLDALESAACDVRGWIAELGDQRSGARGFPDTHDVDGFWRLHLQLTRTQQMLDRFVPFRVRRGMPVSATAVMRAISAAHEQLRTVSRNSEISTDILASCCAADVTDIVQRRK